MNDKKESNLLSSLSIFRLVFVSGLTMLSLFPIGCRSSSSCRSLICCQSQQLLWCLLSIFCGYCKIKKTCTPWSFAVVHMLLVFPPAAPLVLKCVVQDGSILRACEWGERACFMIYVYGSNSAKYVLSLLSRCNKKVRRMEIKL